MPEQANAKRPYDLSLSHVSFDDLIVSAALADAGCALVTMVHLWLIKPEGPLHTACMVIGLFVVPAGIGYFLYAFFRLAGRSLTTKSLWEELQALRLALLALPETGEPTARQAARLQARARAVVSRWGSRPGQVDEPGFDELASVVVAMDACLAANGADALYELQGILDRLDPFVVKPISNAIWAQGCWQVIMMMAAFAVLSVAWSDTTRLGLRAACFAACGGTLGAVVYNAKALIDSTAGRRDYSLSYTFDYVTRPILGSVLGLVVYCLTGALNSAIFAGGPHSAGSGKVMMGLGFLAGFALRSVVDWLAALAGNVFQTQRSQLGDAKG